MDEIAHDATGVIVPTIEKSTVDLEAEQKRLAVELTGFRETLVAEQDPIIANNIAVSPTRITVTYNDLFSINSADVPDWDKLPVEEKLKVAYDNSGSRAYEKAIESRQSYEIFGGRISHWVKLERMEGRNMPATAEQLNIALQGLADQHKKILDARLANSVVGVKAPTLAPKL